MTTGEVIQRVQSTYSKGVQSDDSRLTSRHIYSAILTARSTLLRQRSDKNQMISQWSYQTLPCVELQKATIHECPCIPSNGCMVLRTKYKLPKPINDLEAHLIQSVTSMDGSIRFDESKFENVKYAAGNKFTSKKPDYYFRKGYLFVTVLKQLKALTITGLFDDFIAAYQFPSFCGPCTDCECDDIMDIEFPLDGDLVRPLVDIANNELIIILKQLGEDKSNNSSDDGETAGSMVHQAQPQG